MRRATFGRLQVYIEPRDAWIGVYVATEAVYVLLVPFLVLRWQRRQRQAPLRPFPMGRGKTERLPW